MTKPLHQVGKVAVLRESSPTESYDWLAFTLEDEWNVDYEPLTPLQISNLPSSLDDFDVLVVPDVVVNAVLTQLGAPGCFVIEFCRHCFLLRQVLQI